MAYSQDLKRRVLAFVAAGGSKIEAVRLFSLARSTLYVWLVQPANHQRGKPGPKTGHKIDRAKLAQLIKQQPDLLQREMAQIMGVSANGICQALQAMKITCKKTLRYAQAFTPAGALQRKKYLLRHGREHSRGRALVYLDETGFVASAHRTHGWARNVTTRWSAETVSKYAGGRWTTAKDAIQKLIASGIVAKGGKPAKPAYKLKKDGDLIWLPRVIIEGAANKAAPIVKMRQTQDVMTLRLLVELYGDQNLREDGGISVKIVYRKYARTKAGQGSGALTRCGSLAAEAIGYAGAMSPCRTAETS